MKSITLSYAILVAAYVWGNQVQIVRPPIKYWIENVEFTRDQIQVSTGTTTETSDTNRGGAVNGSQINRTGSESTVEVHAGGEGSVGASATRSGVNPKAEVKITAGGSASKKRTKEELKEHVRKYFVSNSDIKKEEAVLKWTTGNYKLKINIIIENQSTNVTYVYDALANSKSELYVRSSVKSNPLWMPLPLQETFELGPNGGWARIYIDIDVTDLGYKALLSVWKAREVLKECLTLALGGQFCLKDKSENHQDWRPSYIRNAVAIDVDSDAARFFDGIFPLIISGRGLTCGDALGAVSTQLENSDKFRFDDNGILSSGLGLTMGAFTNDGGDVYAIMAEVDGELRKCLAEGERLTSRYDSRKSELRFIKVRTEEVLSGYRADAKKYPKEVVANCLSCIEASLTNSVAISVEDLLNGAELALQTKNFLLYAHFLSCMSDESMNQYLESAEDKQSAMELAIVADNAEYFDKLYSLGWGNANRTRLGFAAEKGSTNIVKWLLEEAPGHERPKVDDLVDGANDDDAGNRGKTPLFWAAKNGHLAVCQYLASKGADINRKFYEKDDSGKVREYDELVDASYITNADIRNYIKAQREVLRFRNMWRPRKSAFEREITRNKVEGWVKAGVLPNSPNSYLGWNWNFLSWAIYLKDVSLIDFLINKGAVVNSLTPDEKRTALMLACEVGDTKLVGNLISKGANLYIQQDDGMTAFYYAIKSKKYNCAEVLLDKLDLAKCSLVEDEDLKLNLLQYVSKYCDDVGFCKKLELKVSAMNGPLREPLLEFLKLREKAAKNSEAQYQLGIRYSNGDGIVKDQRKASYWFYMATKQNHIGAHYCLAWQYSYGLGVPKDKDKAKELRKKAELLEKSTGYPNKGMP